jgi:phospholipid/cholesterol/gamma-HCH transport system substrate-binding protein
MEKPNAKGSNNFVVGLFVFVALLVSAGFVVFMGGTARLAGSEALVKTIFKDVRGLNVGAPVFMSGIQIGRVSGFIFPEMGRSATEEAPGVTTIITVEAAFRDRVRANSEAAISTQGVLGDKIVTVTPGVSEAPPLGPNDVLKAATARELSDYFAKGGNLVEELNKLAINLNRLVEDINGEQKVGRLLSNMDRATASLGQLASKLDKTTAENLDPALKNLKSVLAKIDSGKGTLGALVNDPSLHEDLRILLGGAKRSQMVRFLVREAIKGNDAAASAEKSEKK